MWFFCKDLSANIMTKLKVSAFMMPLFLWPTELVIILKGFTKEKCYILFVKTIHAKTCLPAIKNSDLIKIKPYLVTNCDKRNTSFVPENYPLNLFKCHSR